MAHETLLSGHQGIKRTTDKILQEFYFPLLATKVRQFVKSCELCQRCSNKNVGGQAPIQSLPISSEVFETVYIDIVGEIIPNSAEGHRYSWGIDDPILHFWHSISCAYGSWVKSKLWAHEAALSLVWSKHSTLVNISSAGKFSHREKSCYDENHPQEIDWGTAETVAHIYHATIVCNEEYTKRFRVL